MNHMKPNDLNAYLTKIGIDHIPSVSLDNLNRLHRAQQRRIPFENFDVALNRKIELDSDAIIEQLVYKERGGYCYQVNGLMLQVLTTLGFHARPLLARVHFYEVPTGRSHQVTLVELEGQQWIVDTGFGSSTPRAPLPLVVNQEIETDIKTFRFIALEGYGYLLQVKNTQPDAEQPWLDLYSIDLQPVFVNDIEMANFYSSHSPNSVFCNARIAALPIEGGNITLLNQTLKITQNGHVEEITLPDDDDYLAALQSHLGLTLDATFADFVIPPTADEA